jgi:phage terminase small subunit
LFNTNLSITSALRNPRHERFAQEIAKGASGARAYELAGFEARGRGAAVNAHRLLQRQAIRTRISELLVERERIHGQATANAIDETALTKEWVIAKLMENTLRAMQCDAPRDEGGNVIGGQKYEGAVANRALELLGKELGMFIDRKELKQVEVFRGQNAAEVRQEIFEGLRQMGYEVRRISHSPAESPPPRKA